MSARNDIKSVSRRDFLRYTSVAGGALVLGTLLPSITPAWASSTVDDAANTLNLFVSIDNDGTVNIVCHRSEMGQGVRTGIPQIVADELCADWSKVNVVQGLGDEAYGSQNTDGSRSIRRFIPRCAKWVRPLEPCLKMPPRRHGACLSVTFSLKTVR